MKCAPFCDDSAKRIPRFARIPTGIALDVREPADERVAVELLELGKRLAVDDPRDHLERVELVAEVLRDEPVEVGRVDDRRLRRSRAPTGRAAGRRGCRTICRASASACSSDVA